MRVQYLNNLRALEAVLRTGSLTGAAAELGVTTAAVSQQVRALEAWLDHPLFERGPTGLVPLPAGRAIAGRLTGAFLEIADILAELSPDDAGAVRLTMTAFFANNWLAARLPGFRAAHAGVALEIDAGDRLVDLATSPVDLAIRFCRAPPGGAAGCLLYRERALPVCTPAFAAAHGLGPGQTDLTGVPLFHVEDITSDPDWPDWPTWLARFGMAKTDPEGDISIARIHASLSAALAGSGLVICGITEAFPALRDGLLVAPFGPDRHVPSSYAYHVLWRQDRRLGPAARAFRDWVQTAAETFDGEVRALLGATAG